MFRVSATSGKTFPLSRLEQIEIGSATTILLQFSRGYNGAISGSNLVQDFETVTLTVPSGTDHFSVIQEILESVDDALVNSTRYNPYSVVADKVSGVYLVPSITDVAFS